MKEWYACKDLLGVAGLPKSPFGLLKKADREGWQNRTRSGRGGGKEYHISSLPKTAQTNLARVREIESKLPAIAPCNQIDVAGPQAAPPSMTQRMEAKMKHKAALLGLYNRALATAGWGDKVQARMNFEQAYNSGIAWPQLYEQLGPVSWKTIESWSVKVRKHHNDCFFLADKRGVHLRGTCSLIVPQGMVVKLLEAARSGSIDTYERLARYMDEQISECVLGETLSTNLGGGGSLAAAKTHNEVRLELAEGDADLLSDTINESLIRWIVELNLPGANPPKVWRDFAEPEDLKFRSDMDKNLFDMGFAADEQYINETYGGKWTRRQTTADPPSIGSDKQPTAQFSEPAMDTVDLLTVQTLADVDGADMIEAVYRLLAESGSLEEAQQQLLDIYDRIPVEKTGVALGNRLFQAELTGRAEILDEAGK